jgi:hypothetical protein
MMRSSHASALEAGCATLYSKDLQHLQVVEGRLTVWNPFRRGVVAIKALYFSAECRGMNGTRSVS